MPSEGLVQGEAAGGGGGEAARNKTPGASTGHFRIRRLKLSIGRGERKVLLDGKRPESAADYLLSVRVISFSPEDLFLVKEYPSSRRRFLDRSVFHLRPSYLGLVNQCRAASKQLNSALKAGAGYSGGRCGGATEPGHGGGGELAGDGGRYRAYKELGGGGRALVRGSDPAAAGAGGDTGSAGFGDI